MKTRILRISAFLLTFALLLPGCVQDVVPEVTPDETIQPVTGVKTYTMSIVAGKGGATTKALSVSDHVLSATWTAGDAVTVYNLTKDAAIDGELIAASTGASTTLSGTLEGTIEIDDILQLSFQSANYGSQDGTLTGNATSIDKVCDYAIAEVQVANVDEGKITTVENAEFINQQAIVQFTLKDTNQGDQAFNPQSLTISYGEGSINISSFPTTNGTGVVYVAFPAVLDGVINMTATISKDNLRFYEKTGVTFNRGSYYEISVKMSQLINVSGEDALREALSDYRYAGFIFRLTSSIALQNGELPVSFGATINMNGKTLRAYTGRVFNVAQNGVLTLTGGGTIKGGKTEYGGAIYNAGELVINDVTIANNTAIKQGGAIYNDGGTVTINGGSISNNTAFNAGGIHVKGGTVIMTGGTISSNISTDLGNCGGVNLTNGSTMTMSGGSIENNQSGGNDGGVYIGEGSTLTMTGGTITGNTAVNNYAGVSVNGTLNLSGSPRIYGNTVGGNPVGGNARNVCLAVGKLITVNGQFDAGANIGVTNNDGPVAFTSGYNTYNSDKFPQTIFSADNARQAVILTDGEGAMIAYNPGEVIGDIPYIDENKTPLTCSTYTKMSTLTGNDNGNGVTLSGSTTGGWYVVDKNLTFNKRITISGDVHLILMDNTKLNANNGIFVPSGTSLQIYAQSAKFSDPDDMTGSLTAISNDELYAGIGGEGGVKTNDNTGGIGIYGGVVTAQGGRYAAGIHATPVVGEGNYSLLITGGFVVGVGGERAAGIGGQYTGICGGIKITGGKVVGMGGDRAAGIGSGYGGKMHDLHGSYSYKPGDAKTEIRITGGDVMGWGTSEGAGIGGGAGIDYYDGDAAIVYIDGGIVEAFTYDNKSLYLRNGVIWNSAVAIGWGSHGMDSQNCLFIYEGAKISASTSTSGNMTLKTAADGRGDNWRKFKQMRIEPCDHPDHTSSDCPYHVH